MDGEQIRAARAHDFKQPREQRRVLEPEPAFHREKLAEIRADAPQRAENFLDFRQIPQQPAADVAAKNFRHRTPEIEIDAGDRSREAFEHFPRDARQRGNVLAEQLDEQRLSRERQRFFRAFRDGIVDRRRRGNAQKFRDEKIRRAAPREQPHERERRDVLHRREHREARPRERRIFRRVFGHALFRI